MKTVGRCVKDDWKMCMYTTLEGVQMIFRLEVEIFFVRSVHFEVMLIVNTLRDSGHQVSFESKS